MIVERGCEGGVEAVVIALDDAPGARDRRRLAPARGHGAESVSGCRVACSRRLEIQEQKALEGCATSEGSYMCSPLQVGEIKFRQKRAGWLVAERVATRWRVGALRAALVDRGLDVRGAQTWGLRDWDWLCIRVQI